MKITELFSNLSRTALLEESYKDFKRIFISKTLELDRSSVLKSAQEQAERIERRFVNLQRYMERGDISYWIGRINGTSSLAEFEREVYNLRQAFHEAEMEMEARTPQYSKVYDDAVFMTIVQLENHAAARKLCGGMNICIRSNPSDFASYYEDGDLFLVTLKSSPQKFIVQTNHMMHDGYVIWDSENRDIDVEEFVMRSGIEYVDSDHLIIGRERSLLWRFIDDIDDILALLPGDEF